MKWFKTKIVSTRWRTHDIREITFDVGGEIERFKPGQHIDIKLTAPDGYSAQRSYSIFSADYELPKLSIAFKVLPDGEVTSFLAQVDIGYELEMKGPIGDYFTYVDYDRPLLMLSGGVGVVPFISIIRSALSDFDATQMRLISSYRYKKDAVESRHLYEATQEYSDFTYVQTLTRDENLEDWENSGRITLDLIKRSAFKSEQEIMICGGGDFVEDVGQMIEESKVPYISIKTERFG